MRTQLALSLLLALGLGIRVARAEDGEQWGSFSGADMQEGSRRQPAGAGGGTGGIRMTGRLVPDVHVVVRGDTLWDITGHYFGNPWDWPRVWALNPGISNPHWIYPDDQVRLRGEGVSPAEAQLPSASRSGTSTPAARPSQGTIWLRSSGYLDPDAIEAAGTVEGSPEDHMLLSVHDLIYVSYEDRDHVPPPGTELTIFREVPQDERFDSNEGTLVRILGTAVVREYDRDQELVRAEITEALEPIERGFRVAEMPRRFDAVAPRANDRDLDAQVVATVRPSQVIGQDQLVFVNVGEEDGVRLGNRFFVVRREDAWRHGNRDVGGHADLGTAPEDRRTQGDGEEYPEEIIAEGRVVSVRPHTATLMITRATVEVRINDHAEMRRGF